MTSYRITFERIGRTHDVPALVTTARDAEHLAAQIGKYARKHLRSPNYDVFIDETERTGFIVCGMHNGGTFNIAEVA